MGRRMGRRMLWRRLGLWQRFVYPDQMSIFYFQGTGRAGMEDPEAAGRMAGEAAGADNFIRE